MPVLNDQQLRDLGKRILSGAGASPNHAEIVADELAEANLVGHDSHGVMRLVQYVQFIEEGHIHLDKTQAVVTDSDSFCVIDGQFGFGQVIANHALQTGIEKAKKTGTATILIRNCNHVGRLGSYTEKAAESGLLSMMAVNAPGPGGVAPFGAMERRLGTNPLSIAAPSNGSPFVLDMTTSATAEGKIRVAHQKGEAIPPGQLIDGEGNPSTNPGDYYTKPYGSILPLGGELGHKAFGLSVMIDVLCGVLTNSGVTRTDLPRGANGVWMYFINVESMIDQSDYNQWIEKYIPHITGAKLRPGFDKIYMPGEIERLRKEERSQNGVPIPDETWRQISELAERLNVSLDGIG